MKDNLQGQAVAMVNEATSSNRVALNKRKKQLEKVYESVMNYYPPKRKEWESNLKVNFANQIEQLVTARITAKSPKFQVSLAQNAREIASMYMKEDDEGFNDLVTEIGTKWGPAIQKYLDGVFRQFDSEGVLELLAKQLVRTGNVYGMPVYKYKTYRKKKKKNGKIEIEEKIAHEYPIIEPVPLSELFFDPRYHQLDEADCVIRRKEKVRLSQLLAMKDLEGMMNLDKISPAYEDSGVNEDKTVIYNIMIPGVGTTVKSKTLKVDMFYGYWNETDDPAKEMLYELWVVNESLLIKSKVITEIPICSGFCFGDPEQHFGIGFVEPIIALQEEYNFKMNSSIQAINNNLAQTYLYDPNCGISPQQIEYANAPGQILIANQGVEAAQAGFQQIARQSVDPAYFSSQNEIRADMQTVSFTIDAGNPLNQAGTTDTATAIRAKFFDSNVVYANAMKHYESFLVKLAYKILDMVADNYREDKVIIDLGKHNYEWLDKKVMDESPLRYAISVVTGSSSFDSVENRRENALAAVAIAKEAKEQGVLVDMNAFYEEVFNTFEGFNPAVFMQQEGMELPIGDPTGGRGPGRPGALPQGMPDNMGMPAPIQDGMDLGRFGSVLDAQPQLEDVSQLSRDVVQGTIQPPNL